MSPDEALLALQHVDTTADQLRHRREHLDERDRLATASEALTAWEARRVELNERIASASEVVESAETEGERLAAESTRLNQQLRTVIAPREAEALQHEIENLAAQRSESDERGLMALGDQGEAETLLSEHLAREGSIREALTLADERLQIAESGIDTELGELDGQRSTIRGELDGQLLSRYDRVRAKVGVAAARLAGSKCEGCHLDLSAAEVDEVRRASDDSFPECPQCGRLLVR
ncbi:MAG: zinc ribbon domain-containing protein [Ilumatobacteraceae bacterium]